MAGGAGCTDVTGGDGPWEDATTITGALAPELGPAVPPPPSAPCRLRIASWNVHFGADPADLAAQLLASPVLSTADVIITQEMDAMPSEGSTRASRLAGALGMTWVYAPARSKGEGTHGQAILSRYPLANPVVRQLPYADLVVGTEPRIALGVDVMIDGAPLHVVDVHLDTRLGPVDRVRQLHPAVNDAGERMIVGGDLNTLPWTWVDGLVPLTETQAVVDQRAAAVIDDYLGQNRFTGAIAPDQPTFPFPVFGVRLDNLYARGPAVLEASVEHVRGSDHWPIRVDVDRCH
jgi:endonuclease/exonuclease/phosphatase family metal-dependent hydrolase